MQVYARTPSVLRTPQVAPPQPSLKRQLYAIPNTKLKRHKMSYSHFPDTESPERISRTPSPTTPSQPRRTPALTARHISTSLQLLADATFDRTADINKFNTTLDANSDNDDADSNAPLFDAFYEEGGNDAIKGMISFYPSEFETIWTSVEDFVLPRYNTGRGQRSVVKPKDALFITMTVLKHGGQLQMLARIFAMKSQSFERLVTRMLTLLSDHIYEDFVVEVGKMYTMDRLQLDECRFTNFKEARYATDVTFQQSFRPSGSIEEGKRYYSGKHKLYGYKVEVSVLPNGLAAGSTLHYPGSVSDLEILQRNKDWHLRESSKKQGDSDVADIGLMTDKYPQHWAVLMDKGYQGAAEFMRAISPKKKKPNQHLSLSEEAFNRRVASDRIIVENYFGRLCSLWNLLSFKWRWSEELYDDFFRMGLALTNFHIRWYPLRESDAQHFTKLQNRMSSIADSVIQRRRRVLQRSRERRRARLNRQFRAVQNSQ